MNDLKYKICSNMNVIAAFTNASDRDLCIDTFRDFYSDCEFTTLDGDAAHHQVAEPKKPKARKK